MPKKNNAKKLADKKRDISNEETQLIRTSELKSVKTNKEIKQGKAHSRRRIADAKEEQKVNKKLAKQIEGRVIAHPKLLTSSIIAKGVKNRFTKAERTYELAVKKLEKLKISLKDKTGPNKNEAINNQKMKVQKAKENMKAQKTILKNEVKQVKTLNSKAKGSVSGTNKEGDVITISNVNKLYATGSIIFPALNNAQLSIKKGSFNVILGPSGSGKTTLLNVISGLDRATYGEIIVQGTNISALTTQQLTQFRRNNVGFVFQSYNLLQSLNVSDNIEVGRSLQTNHSKRKDIDKLLESIDMGMAVKKRTYELSGGQQQRVSIARALSKSPEILIGDEPTGALDQATSLKVFELFQEINKTQKATVIIVTHNVNVAELADQVIHVENGRIEKVVQNAKPKQAKNLTTI